MYLLQYTHTHTIRKAGLRLLPYASCVCMSMCTCMWMCMSPSVSVRGLHVPRHCASSRAWQALTCPHVPCAPRSGLTLLGHDAYDLVVCRGRVAAGAASRRRRCGGGTPRRRRRVGKVRARRLGGGGGHGGSGSESGRGGRGGGGGGWGGGIIARGAMMRGGGAIARGYRCG